MSTRKTIWGFKEEEQPCGVAAVKIISAMGGNPDGSNLLAARVESHPWFIIIWEELKVNAPSPERKLLKVWCCYARTIIFYKQPYKVGDDGSYEEYDRVESTLHWDAIVEFEGELFEVGAGQVVWKDGKWWMRRWARRKT